MRTTRPHSSYAVFVATAWTTFSSNHVLGRLGAISSLSKPNFSRFSGFSHHDARSRLTIPQEVSFAHPSLSQAFRSLATPLGLLTDSTCPDSRATFTLAYEAALQARFYDTGCT